MIGTIFFFITSFLIGRTIVKLTRIDTLDATATVSLVVGLVFVCLLLFFSGFVLPFKAVTVAVILVLLTGVSLYALRNDSKSILKELSSWLPIKWSLGQKLMWLGMIVLVGWLFGRALFITSNGNITAGDRLVWTDWPLHIGMAANFAWGQNFPPQNPMFSGIPLIYPFFADFLSGILLVLGAGYPTAFNLPGMVLILVFFHLFLKLAVSILRESELLKELKSLRLLTIAALFLTLFWGGLGFIYWLQEAFAKEVTLISTLFNPPREYTFWGEKGLWFFTFLYSEILPQRGFLFGLPIFVLILLLLKLGWDKGIKRNFAFAAFLAGLLPFFHTHTYLSLTMFLITLFCVGGAGLFSQDRAYRKKYLEAVFLFFLPFGLLSLIQLPLFRSQFHGLPVEWGWMKGSENFFLFWFKNTGFFIPLWFLGLWKGKYNRLVTAIGLASLTLFILPNIFRFAPWGYDNLKIFTFWYLLGSLFVVTALQWIWQKNYFGRLVAAVFFISLVFSGVLEVSRIVNTSQKQIGLWSKEDQEFGREIRTRTKPNSIFLTAAIHDHPVVTLAGRKIVIGYPGNMWSWGIDGWDSREGDVRAMYKGGDDSRSLWQKYNINYIVVGDRERYFEKELDETYIASQSSLLIESGTTKVYMPHTQ